MSAATRRVVGFLIALLVVPAIAAGDPVFEVAEIRRDHLQVTWDRDALRDLARGSGVRTIRGFPLASGTHVDLLVEPFRVTGPGTRFVLGWRGGEDVPIDFDPSTISMFRGRVAGRPGSHVFLAFSDIRSTGRVDLGGGAASYRVASADLPSTITVFPTVASPALPPDVPLCGTAPTPATEPPETPLRGVVTPVKGLRHLELAVETDHEFYRLFDSSMAASTYVTMLYGEVSDIFLRDVDTWIELTYVRLWNGPDDLFNDVDPTPLPDFQNYWNTNMGFVQRDLAQLVSGRRDYPFGGQAYLNGACASTGYSVVGYAMGFFPDPARPSPYHYDIGVTAHEIGHNVGTGHTHESPNNIDDCADVTSNPQRGTIMSYCSQLWSGGNANWDLYFHSRIQQNIDAFIASASCIPADCNRNAVADDLDIQFGTSMDIDLNGVPDDCEDCNANMVLDDADIVAATSADLNVNGIPDECEPDCNGNTVPDDKDIADGTSLDLHGNDIPDECEADCDTDGNPDFDEIQNDMPLDIDRDAVLDACQDCDNDGTIDLVELNQAHFVWMTSGLIGSDLRQFHAFTGVRTAISSGTTVQEGFDLIVTPAGSVLVTSHGDDRILEFDLDGNYLGDLVSSGAGGLDGPAGLVIAPGQGTLLVASSATHEVLAYALSTGAFQSAFVSAGSGGLSGPFGLTFGPDGNLYVTSDNGSVLKYDGSTGAYLADFVPAAANGGLDQPRGLTFKPDGNLVVASYGTDQVLHFNGNDGTPLGEWALAGGSVGITQTSPWGVRVGPNGNVFVSRTGSNYGSGGGGHDDQDNLKGYVDHDDQAPGPAELHLSNAQIYEFDIRNGNFLRTYVGGNDHGQLFSTGFDFVPGWTVDCNVTHLQDDCDLSMGTSIDADMSGVPDECEIDCNGNGVPDRFDLIPMGGSRDCNHNRVPDECDLTTGTSVDCDANGIPDECEPDCNLNGVTDECDLLFGTSVDCDANGVPDDCEIYDDLETDTGWVVGAFSDTATGGIWTRVDPIGTIAQPEDDHTPTPGNTCFVTGQGVAGGDPNAADIDGGATTLTSPPINVASDPDAAIGYWRWFSNDAGAAPGEDPLTVSISNDGGQNWVPVEIIGRTMPISGSWQHHGFRVSDLVAPTGDVRLRFVAEDSFNPSLVEAAIDDITVSRICCPPNAPAEVAGLALARISGTTQLRWATQGAGMIYDVIRGSLSDLRTGGTIEDAQCAVADRAGVAWDDPAVDPFSGEADYFLVRAEDSCQAGVQGDYGESSGGGARIPLADCP